MEWLMSVSGALASAAAIVIASVQLLSTYIRGIHEISEFREVRLSMPKIEAGQRLRKAMRLVLEAKLAKVESELVRARREALRAEAELQKLKFVNELALKINLPYDSTEPEVRERALTAIYKSLRDLQSHGVNLVIADETRTQGSIDAPTGDERPVAEEDK